MKERGITLIALIVTVIVLIILAGITIATLTGEDGIINNANNAKEETEIANEKEIVDRATINAMGNNKRGNIVRDELQDELDRITKVGDTEVKIIRKKLIVEFTNSHRMYRVDDDGNVFEYVYTDLPIMENGTDFNERMADYREKILTVTVLDNVNIPDNAYQIFDVSKKQDGTVKAWLVESEETPEMYDLYIAGNEGVEIQVCSSMFQNFSKCINMDIENLYTDTVQNFDNMFNGDSNLIEIKFSSNFINSEAKNLMYMFYLCTKLKEINTINWNTSNVTNMFGTFRMCQSVESLDLSNFDTSNVVYMDYLFQYCQKLKTIYVGDKWNNSQVTSSDDMFLGCKNLKGAITYDEKKIDINYANYNIGYFTYKN